MLTSSIELLDILNKEKIENTHLGIEKLRSIGLSEFALVTNEMKENKWEYLHEYVPRVTNDDIQQSFTGNTGITLLKQSIDFVRHFYCQVLRHIIVPQYHEKLDDMRILDYGCGWGRLLRLMPYYFSYENILGVDPKNFALSECDKAGILSQTRLIQRDACDLVDSRFEAGYAFSVFTHLPENLMKQVFTNLSCCFIKNGLLLITIRPPEYWNHVIKNSKENRKTYQKALSDHSKSGYSYVPHGGETGEYYGETSMTISWFNTNIDDWKIIDVERSLSDPLQIYLTLQRL